MTTIEYHLQSFKELKEKVKEDDTNFDDTEFHYLIEEIEQEISDVSERVFDHPKYNLIPTTEVPESITLDALEKLVIEIKRFIKKTQPFDKEEILDYMFPNRHDDDFDEDSMNYDSVFGKD
ncbi:hypothetical protein H9I45_00840 [Polaribacter haliotis]|uniref:Uncharacterized protein n=2 Tax=Polaribacter TaxID=52959 RepID=A0A7L8AG77_9FLAO|nr:MULTISPECIES: hypothetical protein [Polaribacter]MDD7914106.1 hypothetical protein [Polaribacter sp. MSW5]QOD61016.1 hypothetical protein H9I45_00840 [Polaribacter haliotis]